MGIGYNRIAIVGNLGRDPETAVAQTGMKITKFSVGVNEKFKDRESTTWLNIITFDKLAEITAQYCRKGQLVLVDGRLQIRQYERQDGSKGTAIEVVANQVIFLEKKRDADPQYDGSRYNTPTEQSDRDGSGGFSDEDLPF